MPVIKIENSFWNKHVQDTVYDKHIFKINDIEWFLQDTLHKSAKVKDVDYFLHVTFNDPKYETLFRLKYSDDIV